MNAAVTITTQEMGELLRKALQRKLQTRVDAIHITSYHKVRITIEFSREEGGSALVEASTFRHRDAPG